MEDIDIDRSDPYSDEQVLDFVKEWVRTEDENDDFEVVDSDIEFKGHRQAEIEIDGGLVADLEEFHGLTPIDAVGEILKSVRKTYSDNPESE